MAGRTEPPHGSSMPRAKVGLVAGGGLLPRLIANQLASAGTPFIIIVVEGEGAASDFPGCDVRNIPIERVGQLVGTLKEAGAERVVLAGSIGRRPELRRIRWNLGLVRMLPRIVRALAQGDDGLLRGLVRHLEENGFSVIGAHEIVPDALAEASAVTRLKPGRSDRADIRAAMQAARAIGALDIGQAAIAVGGRAVALEGIEGTDGLLERMAGMRGHGRLGGKTGGVLAKCAKPGQELRADLPAVGPATVEGAHAAGLRGIAVEAGRTFLLDRERLIERADELGLFVIGVEPEEGK